MPYITQERRKELLDADNVSECSDGDLNYLLTTLVDIWLGGEPRYTTYNSAIGILECVKLELYRRRVALYEDKKCIENGDVYNGSTTGIDSTVTDSSGIGCSEGVILCSPTQVAGSDG